MAVHAHVGGGNAAIPAFSTVVWQIAAVDAQFAGVDSVAVRDGLHRRVADR